MGEGRGPRRRGADGRAASALRRGIRRPLDLREKEGLALINGTDGMLGMLLLALHDLAMLLDTADVAAAMSIESQLGTDAVSPRTYGPSPAGRAGGIRGQPARLPRRLADRG